MKPIGLGNTRILTNPICKMVETLTHRPPPYNEPIIWHHINPHARKVHFFHKLINDYVGHIVCTFLVTRNSSQETYVEKKSNHKKHKPNAK